MSSHHASSLLSLFPSVNLGCAANLDALMTIRLQDPKNDYRLPTAEIHTSYSRDINHWKSSTGIHNDQ